LNVLSPTSKTTFLRLPLHIIAAVVVTACHQFSRGCRNCKI